MDRYRDMTSVPLLEERAGYLLTLLTNLFRVRGYQTQEELARAYHDVAERVLRSPDEPAFDAFPFEAGTLPDLRSINQFFIAIFNEFVYLHRSVRSSGQVIQNDFNLGTKLIRKLQADLKYCNQLLSTYSLYSSRYGNSIYVADSFDTFEKIDVNSSFLSSAECQLDTSEGTISLPEKKSTIRAIENIEIGRMSNGIPGNNREARAPIRGQLEALFDGSMDTWFEYERVGEREDIYGLRLELKVALKETAPINNIQISPVLLGARTAPSIQEILVSEDGRNWHSLKKEISVASFLGETQEGRFHLGAAGSRYSGRFNITFAPRVVKFLKIEFWQGSTFPILDTRKTTWLRYAIGIREIEVKGIEYHPVGEIISRQLPLGRPVSTLAIQSLVDPPFVPEEVGGVDYYLSWDDGASWSQLASLDESRLDVPEILYPEGPVSGVRWKAYLKKNEGAFQTTNVTKIVRQGREVTHWPSILPADLRLREKPIANTISVIEPSVTTRGKSYPKLSIGNGVTSKLTLVPVEPSGYDFYRHDNTQLVLKVPLPIKDANTVRIYVAGTLWTRVKSFSVDDHQPESEVYVLQTSEDGNHLEVVFGNKDAVIPLGKIPQPSDKITLSLTQENLVLKGITDPYEATLDYPSDGEKSNTIIRFLGAELTTRIRLPGRKRKFELEKDSIISVSIIRKEASGSILGTAFAWGTLVRTSGDPSPFQQNETFINGVSEFEGIGAGDWSVDFENGCIYSRDLTDSNSVYTVLVYYRQTKTLEAQDWDFVPGSTQKLIIKKSGYKNLAGTASVSAGVESSSLGVSGIVLKSTLVDGDVVAPYRPFEVPFIDGIKEFESTGSVQNENVPAITASLVAVDKYVASFRPTHAGQLVPESGVFLDGAVFLPTLEVGFIDGSAEFSIDGNWSVDYLGDRRVYLYRDIPFITTSVVSEISYTFSDPHLEEAMKGAYSVDLEDGIVYFATATSSSGQIAFQYAPYVVKYNVARVLRKEKDFSFRAPQTLTIKTSAGEVGKELAISYSYEPAASEFEGIGAYYSPLLRAIAVRGD